MSSSPPAKRQKFSPVAGTENMTEVSGPTMNTLTSPMSVPALTTTATTPSAPLPPASPHHRPLNTIPPPTNSSRVTTPPSNPRKRRASRSPKLDTRPPGTSMPPTSASTVSISNLISEDPVKKKSRTNTPWSAAEEQRLKQMRDAGNSWGEIAKAFPNRTEGSVKKHWYKDMHYAEFAEDETVALRDAIKEYEANKWKAIGAKLGKPAKACEQYAREHFKTL